MLLERQVKYAQDEKKALLYDNNIVIKMRGHKIVIFLIGFQNNVHTRLVVHHGSIAFAESENPTGLSVTLLLGQPIIAEEEVVLSLRGDVYFYFLYVPTASFRNSVMTDLSKHQQILLFKNHLLPL